MDAKNSTEVSEFIKLELKKNSAHCYCEKYRMQ